MDTIANTLKSMGYINKPEEEKSVPFCTLLIKTLNCFDYCAIYIAISEVIKLPILLVPIPKHVFVRWKFNSQNSVNWETTEGLERNDDYYIKKYGPNGWTKGNLANLAIGQGELLTTPLQMAQLAMFIANRGVVHRPHIAHYLYDKNN